MYVRTKEGLIFKIERILNRKDHILLFYDFKIKVIGNTDEIKASHNLLGNDKEPCLIEAGDYVNGHKVLEIYKDRIKFGENGLVLARRSNYDNYYLYLEDIKSIVTKEMFEAMKYEVK